MEAGVITAGDVKYGVVVILGSTGGGDGGEVRAARAREGFVEEGFDYLAGGWEDIVLLELVGD